MAKFTKPTPKRPTDDKKPKTQPNPSLPNWDGMVQKADGTVGKWGNDLKKVVDNQKVSLYPKGEVSKRSVDSLMKSDPKISKLIGIPVKRHKNSQAQYGTSASDIIRNKLNK